MSQLSLSSYGTSDSHETAEPSSDKHAWEERGGLRHLSMEFLLTVGKQFIALSMILVQIYYSKNLMMSCDSRKIGMPIAVMCEYSKAYVRCFPLLAVVMSLIVASRMLLCQRMYYKMLKQMAILDFTPVHPGKDVLYLILVWSACNAFLHFILELSVEHPLNAETLRKLFYPSSEKVLFQEIHKMASLYVLPSMIFLGFLWQAYDVEARLLPLSKYFEDDPEQARLLLSKIEFLPESIAARVVQKKEIEFQDSDGKPLTSDEVYSRFVKQCTQDYAKSKAISGEKSHKVGTETAGLALLQRHSADDEVLEHFSHVHLISEMWPGRLLLSHRLSDTSSVNFRLYWFCCCAMAITTMIGILGLLIEQCWGDLKDVREGQHSDIAGVIVQLAHAIAILYLGPAFIRSAILPYIKALKKE